MQGERVKVKLLRASGHWQGERFPAGTECWAIWDEDRNLWDVKMPDGHLIRMADAIECSRVGQVQPVATITGFGQIMPDESGDGWAAGICKLVDLAVAAGQTEAVTALMGALSLTSPERLYPELVKRGWDDATSSVLAAAVRAADALNAGEQGCTPDCAEFGHSTAWHAYGFETLRAELERGAES